MSNQIPAKLRITFTEQKDYEYHEDGTHTVKIVTPLGFANVYDPHTKAYAKRQKTQDEWAYSGGHWHGSETYFEREGKMWIRRKHWAPDADGKQQPHYTETIVEDYLQPIIIDNTPMDGFRIQKSVSRCSTSNKLWRILDPRGFELEITTGTMEDIIMGGVIDKGLIVGTCVWRTGKILERVNAT